MILLIELNNYNYPYVSFFFIINILLNYRNEILNYILNYIN